MKYLSGGDILKKLASEQGFQTESDDWWDKPEGMKFLAQRQNDPTFDKKVDEKLKDLFMQGGLVITSYTLPWLVDDGIKIWLAGSQYNSADRMKSRDNLTEKDALKIVQTRYDENKILYKKLYNFNFGEDLSVFDKTINTDGLNAHQVLDIAKDIVRELL